MKLVMSNLRDLTTIIQKNYLLFCRPGHNSISPLSSLNNLPSVKCAVSSTVNFQKYTDFQFETVNLCVLEKSQKIFFFFVKGILKAEWESQKVSVNDPKTCFISTEVLTF